MGKLCGCQGPAEEVASSFRATLGLKVSPLFSRFDTFGNHEVLEALAHVNYGAHDGGNFGIGSDLVDKGLVDFQHVYRKLPKIAETGIAGAEVIYGKLSRAN